MFLSFHSALHSIMKWMWIWLLFLGAFCYLCLERCCIHGYRILFFQKQLLDSSHFKLNGIGWTLQSTIDVSAEPNSA